MTIEWLPGVEKDLTAPDGCGDFTDVVNKALFHKTQGGGLDGARSTLNTKGAQPHFLTEIRASKGRRNVQMVKLTKAAKALRNVSGGVATNKDGVIQWEIVGYSEVENERDYTEADWLWFGEHCVGPVLKAIPTIPNRCGVTFHNYPPENGIRLGSEPWRLRGQACDDYAGYMGHQHFDENAHGDPGNLSRKSYRGGTKSAIDLIIEGAAKVVAPTPPPAPKGWLMSLNDTEQRELYLWTADNNKKLNELYADYGKPAGKQGPMRALLVKTRDLVVAIHAKVTGA